MENQKVLPKETCKLITSIITFLNNQDKELNNTKKLNGKGEN